MGRVKEADYIRVFAMMAVIMIHVSSRFIFKESDFTVAGMNLAFILNQFSRFSVPAFVFVSGLSLGLSGRSYSYFPFLKKRAVKIIIPYIVWCVIYMLYNADFKLAGLFAEGDFLSGFIRALLTGDPASHLYFIVIIVQMYLLYIPLKIVKDKAGPLCFHLSLIISAYFITGIYIRSFGIEILPVFLRQDAWLTFPPWLVYFVSGLYLSKIKVDTAALQASRFKSLLAAALLLVILLILLTIEGKYLNTYELSIKPYLLFIVPVFCYLSIGLCRIFKSNDLIDNTVSLLSRHSMNIYFVHVLILREIIKRDMYINTMTGMLILYICVFALSLLFSLSLGALKYAAVKVHEKSWVL